MKHFSAAPLIVICSLLTMAPSVPKPAPLTISIQRQLESPSCIMGYFTIEGEVIAYSLELPWLYNINGLSAIPKGSYSGFIRTDGTKGWRIELLEVEGRKNIQLHVGNYTSEIQGCMLIGERAEVDGCTVLDSRKALEKIRAKLEQAIFMGDVNSSPEIRFVVK